MGEPSITSSVMATSTVYNSESYISWSNNNWPASSSYAVLSIVLLIMGIVLNVLVRAIRIVLFIYRLIPIIGGH